MKRGRGAAGYTIVETLIFMAVSGAMFVSALALINGRQARAEFSTSAREFETQMRDLANDVATGYYPNPVNASGQFLRCTVSGGVINLSFAAADNQGANKDCIFAGRTIHFAPSGESAGSYASYLMLGKRVDSGTGRDVTSITQASPTTVPEIQSLKRSVYFDVTCMFYANVEITPATQPCTTADKTNIDNFSFITTFSPTDLTANGSGAGDTQVSLVATTTPAGVLYSKSAAAIKTEITGYGTGATAFTVNPRGGVYICLQSTKRDQFALVKMGGSGSNFGTSMAISAGRCS